MHVLNRFKYLMMSFLVWSCSNTDDVTVFNTLATYIANKTIEPGGVIACAASDKTSDSILTFYYPKIGAENIRYYETKNTSVDKGDYSNYQEILLPKSPVFNGYLGKFTQASNHEKWMIVTFELDGVIHISNPIKSKQLSKQTVWNDQVTINQTQSLMPVFSWVDNPFGDNAIYFQVITDNQNDLLSGTYTYENHFQYYNTSNVVLNVTSHNPPDLISGNTYNFVLMDVSEDNWVNWVIEKTFQAQ